MIGTGKRRVLIAMAQKMAGGLLDHSHDRTGCDIVKDFKNQVFTPV